MSKKCPDCGSKRFYLKDPEDQYTLYEFELNDGQLIFDEEEPSSFTVSDTSETYCDRCAWHDKLTILR